MASAAFFASAWRRFWNAASARSLERLGFRHEGHLRERWIVDGEVSDTGLYGLLAREWFERRPAP